MSLTDPEITDLLNQWRSGDLSSRDKLVGIIYPQLKKQCQACLHQFGINLSLSATELANEVYLKLHQLMNFQFSHRLQFFALQATLVRRIIVDCARARSSVKRTEVALELDCSERTPAEWLDLEKALVDLHDKDSVSSDVVELKVFGGRTAAEIAEILGISTATITRKWKFAKAWIGDQLSNG